MLKSVFKILLILLFITLSVYFYKQKISNVWGSYIPVIFFDETKTDDAIKILENSGFSDIVTLNNLTIGINDYSDITELTLSDIKNRLDINDYRYDPFIKNIPSLFDNNKIIYIKTNISDLKEIYRLYTILKGENIDFNIGNPIYLRILFNYISSILILIILSIGCKKRFLITVIASVLIYFFMNPASVYSYISFILGYFILIMIIESLSFSNRYIKRNNVGIIRIIFVLLVYTLPSSVPLFIDLSQEYYTPVIIKEGKFDYYSMEKSYIENSSTISNYLTHYTFQKSFLYDSKYLFPTNKNSVTIDEFKREDYYLSRYEKVVLVYDDVYLQDFLSYCKTTVLGRFYLDYGRPFKLELNSLLSLYSVKNEFKLIGLIAITMLITSLFFKKSRDKKLKY